MTEILIHNLPIFAIIIFGYLCTHFRVIGLRSASILTDFVFFIAIPAMLISQFASQSLKEIFNAKFISAFLVSSFIMSTITYAFSKRSFPHNLSERAISLMVAAQINTTYLAIPVFFLFFKNITPVILVIILQTIFLTPCTLAILEYDIYKKEQSNGKNLSDGPKLFLKHLSLMLIKAPVVPAAVLGVILSYYSIDLPVSLLSALSTIGKAAAPVSLFVLGVSLKQDKIVLKDGVLLRDIVGLTFLKNFLHPTIAFLMGHYIFHLDSFWLISLCLLAAMPAARNANFFAQRYGLNVTRTNTMILLTTFTSFLTIGFIITLFKKNLQDFIK